MDKQVGQVKEVGDGSWQNQADKLFIFNWTQPPVSSLRHFPRQSKTGLFNGLIFLTLNIVFQSIFVNK